MRASSWSALAGWNENRSTRCANLRAAEDNGGLRANANSEGSESCCAVVGYDGFAGGKTSWDRCNRGLRGHGMWYSGWYVRTLWHARDDSRGVGLGEVLCGWVAVG